MSITALILAASLYISKRIINTRLDQEVIPAAQVLWAGCACAVISREPRSLHETHCQFLFFVYKFVILSWNEYESLKSRLLWDNFSHHIFVCQKYSPAESYRHVFEVYGENFMSGVMARRWCRMFREERTNVHDDRSGRKSLVTAVGGLRTPTL
jgi:hypothetical protein